MNKIKSQFKSFWAYFRLTRYGVPNDANAGLRQNIFLLLGAIATVLAVMFQTSIGENFFIFDFSVAFFVGAAVGVGIATSVKPSLLSVAPFSPKQRVIFSYLSAVLTGIITFVFYVVALLLFGLVIAFFAYVSTGTNIFLYEDEEVMMTGSGWYKAFSVLYSVYMFFTAYAIANINRKKYRNIATVVWFAVTEILTLVLINCCADAYYRNVFPDSGVRRNRIVTFMFLYEEYDYLAHPWVPVLIIGVITAIAIGLSIWLSIRRHRSGKV